jgi:DNA polymerase-3 subunit delta
LAAACRRRARPTLSNRNWLKWLVADYTVVPCAIRHRFRVKDVSGMHAIDFLRGKSGKPELKPVYAVFGDDAYLKREAIHAALKLALGVDAEEGLTRFAGENASLADVLDEVRTLPFLSSRRVALVDNADPFITAHRKELEAYTEHPSSSGILILNAKSWTSTTRLAKLVEAVGTSIDCRSPKASELPPWLIQMARDQYDRRLESEAAKLLIELVGDEIGVLASELEKVAVFVGDRATINRNDVSKIVGAGRVEDVWKMLNEATTGNSVAALHHLDRLLATGENAVGLLAAMCVSLRKVHHAGYLRKQRMDIRQACREAGIPPFVTDTTQRQHAHLGPKRVDGLPELLLQADLALKGSSMLPPRVVLEQFLLTLSLPRTD